MTPTQRSLTDMLEATCRSHRVPGAAAALYCAGKSVDAAVGAANVATGISLTRETLMHVGSITKVLNATLVMQLVDEGKLSLSERVSSYIPDFGVGDARASREITVAMLLDHTSGIDGELLPDYGHDDETIEKAMCRFRALGQIHSPGTYRSYCNVATVIAGYLCQRVARASWYDLVVERILKPLQLTAAAVLPEHALLQRVSVGHFLDPATQRNVCTTKAFLPLSFAPAGSTLMMSAAALMRFAQMHLRDGVGENGERILSTDGARTMREPSGAPDVAFRAGLGWLIGPDGILFHSGGGPGINSYIAIHPESATAVAVLTNAEHGRSVIEDVIGALLQSQVGTNPFSVPSPAEVTPSDYGPYLGTYETAFMTHIVERRGDELVWSAMLKQAPYDSTPPALPAQSLVSIGDHAFVVRSPKEQGGLITKGSVRMEFVEPDGSGRMRYLAMDKRLYARTSAR